MKAYLYRVLLLGSVFMMACTGAQFASAQTTEGLQIKPAIFEEKATPGNSYNFELSVTNIGESQKTFYLSTQDIKGLDQGGRPIFAEPGEKTGYELSSWVSLPSVPIT